MMKVTLRMAAITLMFMMTIGLCIIMLMNRQYIILRRHKMQRFKYVLVLCVMVLGLMACGKKEDPILPFSAMVPGMTFDEIKKIEPEIEDVSEYFGTALYMMNKEYGEVEISTIVFPDGETSGLTWNIKAEKTTDLKKFIEENKEYCNKRYTLIDDSSTDKMDLAKWETKEYSISILRMGQRAETTAAITILPLEK